MKAVFAGSFDPPTLGHLDIIARAAPLFSELRVLVGRNLAKEPLLPVEERVALLARLAADAGLANVVIEAWDGLVAEYAKAKGCDALLRSIRNMGEIPYEQMMATYNRRLLGGVETVFLFARPEFVDISSSAVRELVAWKRLPRGIVPELVEKELEKRYGPLLQD
ncbi:pantetheine-phosphate adenylyltransferase [bacterium]|nr:pantetheine-phosphate adenylyltransferase [bacterium]